jgi:hypothetical protein
LSKSLFNSLGNIRRGVVAQFDKIALVAMIIAFGLIIWSSYKGYNDEITRCNSEVATAKAILAKTETSTMEVPAPDDNSSASNKAIKAWQQVQFPKDLSGFSIDSYTFYPRVP